MTTPSRTLLKLAHVALAPVALAPVALALALAACSNSNDNAAAVPPPVAVAPAPAPAPAPSPSPTPTPSPASRNVTACLNQVIPGTNGRTVASLAVPDALRLDFAVANGFPNGRRFDDPVVDITLAALLIDLNRHAPGLLASLPLNPPNDNVNAMAAFPFLGPVNGMAQPSSGTGTAFNFRTDPITSFVRVDRMGNPAVGSIINGPLKNAFNDGSLADDIAGNFLGGTDGFVNQLAILHNGLFDDLMAAGLTPCSTP